MSAIVVKSENNECEDVKPQIKEGGGVINDDAVDGADSVVTAGTNAAIKKTESALKVENKAKHLNLRLKDQNLLLMPKNLQHQPATNIIKSGKRSSFSPEKHLQTNTDDGMNVPYKFGNKRFRVQTPTGYMKDPRTAASPLLQRQPPTASSKCGEIFVTNNARKWTFVCTYCQKSTRDIGEFVCHIKHKHLLESYNEDDGYNAEEYVTDRREDLNDFVHDDGYDNHDQDYFDCGNYLDVNVHTEADDLPNKVAKIKSNMTTATQIHPKQNNNRQKQKNIYVVNLLDDDDDGNNGKNAKKDLQKKNKLFEYDMEEEDDAVEIINDENNEVEGREEDNLLFLRSSSIEDTLGDNTGVLGKGGSKKYRSHVRGKAYCNLCDKTFQYYSLYRNHMIKHSNITPYKCEYCSKAFKSKQAIRYHMNTHTKEVQYTCPLCPMTYGTENQFITHVLNHESNTCFPCMVCAKILKSDQDREEHLSTHTEERPFGCNYCNKRFRQKHHLSNHLKLHCQYRCDFCKEEFSSTQTQRRPYACASCEEYPEIRIQVEKQRSKSLNNSEVNPLEISNEGGGTRDSNKTGGLATDNDDDESETSTSMMTGLNDQNQVTCQYCTRVYKNSSALNYHMRQKHSHVWRDK